MDHSLIQSDSNAIASSPGLLLPFNKTVLFYMVAIGLVSSGLLLLEYYLSFGLLSVDGYNYIIFARSVINNGWDNALEQFPQAKGIPPLLSLLMILGSEISFSLFSVGRFLNIFGTLLACQGILFICLSIYKSHQTAFLTALIVISLPKIYFEGCGILRDPLFWAEISWSVFCLVQLFQDRILHTKKQILIISFCVFLSSLGCLTRKEGLPFLFLALAHCIYIVLFKMTVRPMIRIMFCLLIVLFSGAIVFLPYIAGIPFVPGNFIVYQFYELK